MKSTLFLFNKAPYGSQSSRELLDITLMTSAFELPITAVFLGDGILQLLDKQTPEVLNMKNHSPTFKALELYGVETILVSERDLKQRGLSADTLLDIAQICDATTIQQAIANADTVFSL